MIRILLRLFRYVWPYRAQFALSAACAMVVAVAWSSTLALAFPIVKILKGESLAGQLDERIAHLETHGGSNTSIGLLHWFRDNIVAVLPADAFDVLALMLILLLAATVVKGLFRYLQEIIVASFVERALMDVRRQSFEGALRKDFQTLTSGGTSDMMSRFTHDMGSVRETMLLLSEKLVREPLKAFTCLICALYVNWQLTLLSLVFVPIGIVVFTRIGKLLKLASRRCMEAMSRIYQVLEESFDSIKTIIAFDGGERQKARVREEHAEYYAKAMTISRLAAITSPIMEAIGILAVCALVLPGAYLVLRETRYVWGIQLSPSVMGIEQLALLYTLLAGMIDPAKKISDIFARTRRGSAAAQRVFDLMDGEPVVADPAEPKAMSRHCESLVFEGVRFGYRPSDPDAPPRPPALDGVDLEITAGECVAIVGENGSGKSTLVNLLPRFFDPNEGTVKIDGVDIRDVPLAELRGQIGVVTQEPLLFNDTVAANIRYGKPTATDAEVQEAARRADLLDVVEALPEGFETVVGEMGDKLSGGQRQRLTLARAIVRDPAILVLDEATSAVDAQSTHALHGLLEGFVVGRTTFVVTHSISPSLLAFVTRIVVMDRGRVIATGSHESLLRTCPVYQRLFDGRSDRISA